MKIDEALKLLNSKFSYKSDKYKKFDTWNILHGDGKWEGDCEDYSLTLMWLLSDKNILKFIWNVTTFKFLMWFVTMPSGVGHAVVRINGFYYDNIQKKATTREEMEKQGYVFKFPMIFPIVYFKLVSTWVFGLFFK